MGIETALAIAAIAIGGYSAVKSQEAQAEARSEAKKSQREQKAANAARAAQERRQQVREERIRRARILQQSENTGVSGSSGQMGALGNLATQLNTNLGFNAGQLMSSNLISGFQQNAMTAQGQSQTWDQIYGLSGSIFNAAGGFGAFKSAPAAGATPQANPANISKGGGFSTSM